MVRVGPKRAPGWGDVGGLGRMLLEDWLVLLGHLLNRSDWVSGLWEVVLRRLLDRSLLMYLVLVVRSIVIVLLMVIIMVPTVLVLMMAIP